MKNALPSLAILVLGFLVVAGAQPPPPAAPAPPVPAPLSASDAPTALVRTELFFGRVSPVDWDGFLSQVVTPRFPDGLTWYDTHGQWQNPSGIVTKEDSCVLILLHAPTPEKDRYIQEIRSEYKARFQQQSVLRADQAVTASF